MDQTTNGRKVLTVADVSELDAPVTKDNFKAPLKIVCSLENTVYSDYFRKIEYSYIVWSDIELLIKNKI